MATSLVTLTMTASSDPRDWDNEVVFLPEGCGMIRSGRVKRGDLYVNRLVALARRAARKGDDPGILGPLWVPVRFPIRDDLDRFVSTYAGVARPGAETRPGCERCLVEPRAKGQRYCAYCSTIVLRAGRRGV